MTDPSTDTSTDPSTVPDGLVHVVADEGLGNCAYVTDLGDGGALVVDPPRDLRAVRAAAATAGLRIRFVADTHLHADFLSGARQLAHDEGATVLASRTGRRRFDHRGLGDGDRVDLGGLILTSWTTPGHTDEHLCYLLGEGERPLGVFTGGSLIVGSAARTDLLGADRTRELTDAQYRSLQRLSGLPNPTAVWPTHGAGSFCSAPPGAARTSTIGRERATNPLLALPDADAFAAALLGSLGSYPSYFARLGEINRRGPALLDPGAGLPAVLPVPQVRTLRDDGATVLDVRPVPDYAAGHIPASVSIPLRDQFATWLGWLVAPDSPVVVVRNPDQDPAEIAGQALKIGYERLAGELDGGIPAWAAAGQPTAATELVTPEAIQDRRVIDVRQRGEFRGGHLPGVTHIELGALAATAERLPAYHTVLMCGHGERAAGAASLLERAGHHDLAILVGGPDDWAAATGRGLTTG
jgi:glyoxylase-like metal-dependent hydrolase (beta-lactamase superfamily II)/rhodanese-related sulfurtransferase